MRFLIANTLDPDTPASFGTIDRVVPDMYVTSVRDLRRLGDPRFIKTHEPSPSPFLPAVYLVRDPRNVMASYHRYFAKRGLLPADSTADRFVEDFLAGRLDPFGTWDQHVVAWRNAEERLLLRYEDLVEDPEREFASAASFLGLRGDPAAAVAKTSAESMARDEQAHSGLWSVTSSADAEVPFVAAFEGSDGGHPFHAQHFERVEQRFGETMAELGYLP